MEKKSGRGRDAAARVVELRSETIGADRRNLRAYVDELGRLHIDGQDLGPATDIVSNDGEYEWFKLIKAVDVPRLVALLGGDPNDDILDLLASRYCGDASYELEAVLRDSGLEIELHVWS